MTPPLLVRPLDRDAFAPFGRVIAPGSAATQPVNEGFARRADLAALDTEPGTVPRLALYSFAPRALPLRLDLFERHPASAQVFLPLGALRVLVVVAEPDPDGLPDPASARAFLGRAGLGVLYRRNLWHMPLIALGAGGEAVMAIGERRGCDTVEHRLAVPLTVAA